MDHEIPVIMAVLENIQRDAPRFVFAISCSLDPEEAITKALEELAHSHRYSRLLLNRREQFLPNHNFSNVVDRVSHVSLYCHHRYAHLARFLFNSEQRIGLEEIKPWARESPARGLQTLVKKIKSIGHRILLCDVTTDDVRGVGLSVFRAIIPGFHRLCIGHRVRTLGGTRLWEIPQKLGYKGISRSSGDNPAPHPVP
jgi:ribosomal protein S12 methylthiotransferase accessory factor